MPEILIRNYRLTFSPAGEDTLVWGEIDPESLKHLLIGDYQREPLPVKKLQEWIESYKAGSVPEWDLGMRGASFTEASDTELILHDPVFIIDGQQRREAAYAVMEAGVTPIIRGTARFNSTVEAERKRFAVLNGDRVGMSPNVEVANLRHSFDLIKDLFAVTGGEGDGGDPSFFLADRVCWRQRRRSSEFITAVTLAKVAYDLHRHLGYTGTTANHLIAAKNADMIAAGLSSKVIIANLHAFFQVLETKWELTKLAKPGSSPVCGAAFLIGLARVFSAHSDFWSEDRQTFGLDKTDMARLHRYPILDASSRSLKNETSFARDIKAHFNKGRENRGGGMTPWEKSVG